MNRHVGALIGAAMLLGGCGSGSERAPTAVEPAFQGGELRPAATAPPIDLRNANGRRVRLSDMRGHATFVTFVYANCPDVCPLILSHLRRAQDLAAAAGAPRPRVIAVSVDPKGDTPGTVRSFVAIRQMTGRMEYLVGSRTALERTWADWGIAARVSKEDPSFVEHAAPIFGIGASGRRLTIYPVDVSADVLAADVPALTSR